MNLSRRPQYILPLVFLASSISFLLIPALQAFSIVLPASTYFLLHTFLEGMSVAISLTIFLAASFDFKKEQNLRIFFLGCAFLAVGILDGLHTLAYPGTPHLVFYPSTDEALLMVTGYGMVLCAVAIPLAQREVARRGWFGSGRERGERKRAEAEILRRNEELSAQNAIAAAINQSLDLQTLLDTALEKVIEVLKVDWGAFYLLDLDGATLSMRAHRGLSEAFVQKALHLDVEGSYSGQAMIEGKIRALYAAEFPDSWRFGPLLNQEGMKTLLCIPLLSKGVPLGSLNIGSNSERTFTENEIELLVAIARQIGVGVENSRLYEQILQQKQYAETVLRSIADGVYTVDKNLMVLSWSKGAEAITGYSHKEVLGRPCSGFLRHKDEAGLLLCSTRDCPLSRVMSTGRSVAPEQVFAHHKDGRLIHVAVTAAPIFDESGQSIGGVEVFRDVSKERELLERIQAASKAKSEFLAGMSHELRTPLNAIIGFSQVLQEGYFGSLNEKQTEYLQDILDSGKHLLALINEVLDLSKVEAGKMELDISPVNIKDLVEHSLVVIKEQASKHAITLELHISSDLENLQIAADDRKLKQIMFNLLSNAAKFTPDGGSISVWAEIIQDSALQEADGAPSASLQSKAEFCEESPQRNARVLRICVADTGIGISPEDREKVFDEFYQVRGGTMDKTPGTGLGLSLVRRFVQMHGGRIWSESEGLGKGSRFCCILPMTPPSLKTGERSPASQAPQGLVIGASSP